MDLASHERWLLRMLEPCCHEAPWWLLCFVAWCFSDISKRTLKIKLNHYMAVGVEVSGFLYVQV